MVIDSALSARARVAFKIFTISSASAIMSNIAISDLSTAISRKRCKIGGKLVLITNRKSYMSFRLVPKSVTVNDREWRRIMVALCNRADRYIFILYLYFFLHLFSSPNLSGRRLDVYHTLAHGVALVRI